MSKNVDWFGRADVKRIRRYFAPRPGQPKVQAPESPRIVWPNKRPLSPG